MSRIDKAMKLDLLPPVLAGSLTFSEFVACMHFKRFL